MNKNSYSGVNTTSEHCIIYYRDVDICEKFLNLVTFTQDVLVNTTGKFTFSAKCSSECLLFVSEYTEIDPTVHPPNFQTIHIIIISTLSAVLAITVVFLIILIIKKKKQDQGELIKNTLLSLPKDI